MADVKLTYTFRDGDECITRYTLPDGMSARVLRDQLSAALAEHTQVHLDHSEEDLTATNPEFVGKVRVETLTTRS